MRHQCHASKIPLKGTANATLDGRSRGSTLFCKEAAAMPLHPHSYVQHGASTQKDIKL